MTWQPNSRDSQQWSGYIARGVVMRREQQPLETVFGPVRWVAIPNDGQWQDPDFAVIRIFDEDRDDKWQVGFYSFDGDIMQIEEGGTNLHQVPETLPLVENLNRQPP
jgi:hypothetical protein